MSELSFRAAEVTRVRRLDNCCPQEGVGEASYAVFLRSGDKTTEANMRVRLPAPKGLHDKLPLPSKDVIIEALQLCMKEVAERKIRKKANSALLDYVGNLSTDKFPKVVMVAEEIQKKRVYGWEVRLAG